MSDPGSATPGERRIDVALAGLLVGLGLLVAFTVPDVGPGERIGGAVACLAMVAPVLMRRRHPRRAVALYGALAAVQAGLTLPAAVYGWPVLAFALLRGPRKGAGYLALVLLGSVGGAAVVWAALGGHSPASGLGFLVGLGLSLAPQVVIGGVLGRLTRSAQRREAAAARDVEERRVADTLAAERDRIAAEVGGGVVRGLRLLADRTDRLRHHDTSAALVEVHDAARQLLAGMRRVLTVLRQRTSEDPTPPAGRPAPAHPSLRNPPLPTSSGIALVAVFAAVAAAGDAVVPGPTGRAVFDRLLPLLDVQFDRPSTVLLLGVQLAALAWWRSAPRSALVLATAGALGSGLHGSTNLVVESGWSVLVYAAATGAPAVSSAAVTAVCTVAVLAGYIGSAPWQQRFAADAPELAGSFALVPLLWAVGALRRWHRTRLARHDAAQLAGRTRGLVDAQRHGIARELHDVVAHHVSAIAVQAGAARYADDPDVLREAVGHIEESGRRIREALPGVEELTPHTDAEALTPDGVERLTAAARATGMPVTVSVSGTRTGGEAELFAGRIVTEALTNVVRHAGASPTRVSVVHGSDAVDVEVTDAGPVPGHRPGHDGSGLGLVGMRERAELLGGELTTGPAPGGGWSVRARLPRPDLLPEEETAAGRSSAPTTRSAPGSP